MRGGIALSLSAVGRHVVVPGDVDEGASRLLDVDPGQPGIAAVAVGVPERPRACVERLARERNERAAWILREFVSHGCTLVSSGWMLRQPKKSGR